jgi:hypothetical protein
VFVPDAVSGVYITNQLLSRVTGRIEMAREKLAMQDIAHQMANNPSQVLPTLVGLAVELCGAVAGGITTFNKLGALKPCQK